MGLRLLHVRGSQHLAGQTRLVFVIGLRELSLHFKRNVRAPYMARLIQQYLILIMLQLLRYFLEFLKNTWLLRALILRLRSLGTCSIRNLELTHIPLMPPALCPCAAPLLLLLPLPLQRLLNPLLEGRGGTGSWAFGGENLEPWLL